MTHPSKQSSSPEREHKFIELRGFKASEDGSGSFEGYANDFGVLDSYDDICLPGAYTDTVEQFKAVGWSTTDHSWGVKDEIGIIVDAYEDERGLFFRSEYHPTQDAQQIRAKVNNRLAKGKAVRLSIGYVAEKCRYVSGKDAIQFLTEEQKNNPEVIARLKTTSRVRLLEKITLFEVSIVSVPAEPTAAVTAAKSAPVPEDKQAGLAAFIKGMFETALAARTNSLWNLESVLESCLWNACFEDECAEIYGTEFDLEATLREILSEFTERVVMSLLGEDDDEDPGDIEVLSADSDNVRRRQAVAAKLARSHSGEVVATVTEFVEKMKKNAANRTKEGRVLSDANRKKVQEARDALQELLDTSEPAKADEAPSGKATDLQLLRLQLDSIEADLID